MLSTYARGSSVPIESTIDLENIRNWRRACRNTHGDCCNDDHAGTLAQHIDRLTLVDVFNGSLVTLSTSSPITYVALSYVWGAVPMFKTKRSNIDILLQPGALYNKQNGIVLPDTIRDAIYLAKALGERYVWVDCLSIVQDACSEEMEITLRAMARIYASADFTIVASDGNDADHGLRGVGGPSKNRIPSPQSYSHLWSAYPEDSKWASRGWTFQESLFSRRLLIFGSAVSWMCGRCEWREGIHMLRCTEDIHTTEENEWPAERPHLGVPMGMMSLIPTIPSLGRWGMLLENFSSRHLTYEKDARAAFAGATEIMNATFPEGILYGMPKFFFDIALLWLPKDFVLRREGEPSWSCMGWKDGIIDCLSAWYPFYANIFRDSNHSSDWVPIATLRSVAEYRMADTADGIDAGFNGFYEYQAFRDSSCRQLPTGWRRHRHPNGDYFTNILSSRKYSFPLPGVSSAKRQIHTPSAPVLHCFAPCATLTFGCTVTCDKTHRMMMVLCNGEEMVGNLTLMCNIKENIPPHGSLCELIAILAAETSLPERVAQRGWPIMSFGKDRKLLSSTARSDEGGVSFYNVMWIRWVGNIAERRGLGIVHKEFWDALEPELREIILG